MKLIKKIIAREGWHFNKSPLPIQIGVKHSNSSVSGPHLHRTMAEYFLVLEGKIVVQVCGEQFSLEKGDLLVVEPGEDHVLRTTSSDALYLLLMPCFVENDKVDLSK